MKMHLAALCLLVALGLTGCGMSTSDQDSNAAIGAHTLAATGPAASTWTPLIMGTGTEWSHWTVTLSTSGVTTTPMIYTTLKNSQVPTHTEKTYLNGYTDASHFQDLLNNGISPVMLEENEAQTVYCAEYPSGCGTGTSAVWDANISTAMNAYLTNTIAPRLTNLKAMSNPQGLNIYYVLNPEFTIVGDTKTSTGYAAWLNSEVNQIRAANIPHLKIVLGYLDAYTQFETAQTTIQTFISANSTLFSKLDYFGFEFHDQLQVDDTVAARMITFLTTIHGYAGIPIFIPNSYVYWDYGTYNGLPTGTEANAVLFWNYLHAHRSSLVSAGVVGWTLSASFEARGGSGLVQPQIRPSPFAGYVYPFGVNNTYNDGGIAYANWMRDESPYTITNVGSSRQLDVSGASTTSGAALVQNAAGAKLSQEWVLIQIDNGYWELQDKNSGLYACVANYSDTNGAAIVQLSDPTKTHAQWFLVDKGNGNFALQNRANGQLMTVSGSSNSDGAAIVQMPDASSNYQLWTLAY